VLDEAPVDGERSDNMPTDVHVHVVREGIVAGDRQDWRQFVTSCHSLGMGTYERPRYQKGYKPKESAVARLRVI
jgi:hypothetical protein